MADIKDLAKAKAFTIWVRSIIGDEPEILIIESDIGDIVQVNFSDAQREKMINWLDTQMGGLLQTDKPATTLQLNLGEVLIPWSGKYLIPAGIASFILGYVFRLISSPTRR